MLERPHCDPKSIVTIPGLCQLSKRLRAHQALGCFLAACKTEELKEPQVIFKLDEVVSKAVTMVG